MKIISVDNFDREILGVSDDKLIADNVVPFYADVMVAALNAKYCNHDSAERFFKAVPDDYILRVYEP